MPKAKAEGIPLSEADLRLWRKVTREAQPLKKPRTAPQKPKREEPLQSRLSENPLAEPTVKAPPLPKKASEAAPPARKKPELVSGEAPGLDARTADKLRRGQLPIQARLDLHGHTQEEAHRALIAFIDACDRRGARCLLVITGKGQRAREEGTGGGVLRSAVPRWLNAEPLRSKLLAFASARPKDGGAGAFYLLLRRKRP